MRTKNRNHRWVLLAAMLLAAVLLTVSAAGRHQNALNSEGSAPVLTAAVSKGLASEETPPGAFADPADLGLDPMAITLRPGTMRTSHPLAAGLVGLVLAALALSGLTAAVLARRDEATRY